MSWNGRTFVLEVPYSVQSISYVRQLDGAWWNASIKRWICKASLNNLEKIQDYFQMFDESVYQDWHQKLLVVEHPCKVILYQSPRHDGLVCVELIGYGANTAIVKRISGREWHREEKIYTLPYRKETVETLIREYEGIGYPIENRLVEYVDPGKVVTTVEVVERFMKKVSNDHYGFMMRYTDVMLRHNYGVRTIKSYTSQMIKMLNHLGKKDMSEVSVKEVNAYINLRIKQNISFSLINQVYSAILLYYKTMTSDTEQSLEKLKRPRKSQKLPTYLSENEILRMINEVENIKHLCVLYLLYGAGLRRGEVINLELKDIYWDRDQIRINNGKGQKDRIVNLSAETKEMMTAYFRKYKPVRYLIEGTKPGSAYSVSSIAAIVKNAAHRAKITKRVTPHALRHSFATHLMDRGTALPKIQALLGHKNIKTTMIYTHLTVKSMKKIESPLDAIMRDVKKSSEKAQL